jgi:hypothetical protein
VILNLLFSREAKAKATFPSYLSTSSFSKKKKEKEKEKEKNPPSPQA